MIYRAWEEEDLSEIAALEAVCFSGESWTEAMFRSSFEQNGFCGELCENEGNVLAYGCVQYVFDSADLLNIAVAPQWRNRGMGRIILQRLLLRCKEADVKKIFLEVRISNIAAKSLYQSEGFTSLSIRKKYYPDGEDALVMVKEL